MASKSNRPTSPHLQIYRLPLTGLISITHRMTGVLLSAGLVFCVYALLNIADGEPSYQKLKLLLDHGLVRIIYWGFIFALCFHLCHGLRHLFWDAGAGFDKATLDRYALIELGTVIILTISTIFMLG